MRARWLAAALAAAVCASVAVAISSSGTARGTDPPTTPTPTTPRPDPAPQSITIEWVGDIAFGEQFGLPPGGLSSALAPVRRYLDDADLTMGNLEGTLAVGGTSKCSSGDSECFAYEAPPAYAAELHGLGFRLLNQANNHTLDFGPDAERETHESLTRAHIVETGLAGQIARLTVKGIRVAVLGFAPYKWANSLLDIQAAQELVRRAKQDASLVVVIIHAGAEGATKDHVPHGTEYAYGEDRGDSRAFTHATIDAGASIVLGSGPHVVRGIERYRGHMIAYSLGDFACWNNLALGGTL